MAYRRRPHSRPFGGTGAWFVLIAGLSIPFTILILSESLVPPAIATVILVPAIALFFEIRRRREVWSRLQRQHRSRSRFEERTRVDETSGHKQLHPWWQVLGVQEQSTTEDVKAAYRAKIKQFHPDTVIGLAKEFQELAEFKTKEINRAYQQACRSARIKRMSGGNG